MERREVRVSGCLSRKDADRLWHDLVAYRNATGQTHVSFARKKFGSGFAVYRVERLPSEGE